MKYHTLLFDADETLFDFSRTETAALEDTFLAHEMEFLPMHFERYKEINHELWSELEAGLISSQLLRTERFSRLFQAFKLDLDPVAFSGEYLVNLGRGAYLLDGAEELCAALSAQGYRLAIITNGIKEVQHERIRRSPLSNTFEQIIVSEEAGSQKPESGIFDVAFAKLGLQAKDGVLMIGDSLSSDIQGGNRYGIETCWFNPRRAANKTVIQPTYEIHALHELFDIIG